MFVIGGGGWGVSRTGGSVRAGSLGGDGSSRSSPGRSLLGRLGDEDEANHARFLGTSLTSGSGRAASIVGFSEIGKLAGVASSERSSTGGVVTAVVEGQTTD